MSQNKNDAAAEAAAKDAAEKEAAAKDAAEKEAAAKEAKKSEGKTRTVKVQGPQGGRRRAGLTFGPESTEVQVTKEQFDAILADPMLKIVK
jgi:hypothetical protein